MAKQTRYTAEILDPVPQELAAKLHSRSWIVERGDDAEGEGLRYNGMSNADEDVEGQSYKYVLHPADGSEDDVEGDAYKSWLRPADGSEDDAEGQAYRGGYLNPVEGEDDDVLGLG